MTYLRIAALALAGTLLSACASSKPVGMDPRIEVAELSSLPSPELDETAIVRPQDSLRVDVLGFPDLSRELQVSAAGTFPFPLIGTVEASGKDPSIIAQDIANRLRGPYVVDPVVTVDVLERPGRLITLGGEVARPGRYPIFSQMSLLEAVATGGGTTDTAKLQEVIVLRTVGGQRYIGVYDLSAIQRGNYDDPTVYPGDIIQVGESPTLRRLQAVTSLAPLITTPIILLDRVLR